jgi:hypothetical protein
MTAACHCTGCQRMSASAYSLTAMVPSTGFEVTSGGPVIGGLHGAIRHFFCPHCMTWMFTRPNGFEQFVNVRPTMLKDSSWFVPFIETYTSEKLPWVTVPAVHISTISGNGEFYSSDGGIRQAHETLSRHCTGPGVVSTLPFSDFHAHLE